MKVDAVLTSNLHQAAAHGRRIRDAGFSGAWTSEIAHDPFLPIAIAGADTAPLELGTSIAVALARSPMTLANTGWDLQALTRGRFVLGLGSQIKPHITRRFDMPWSHPASRMREMVLAIRAIWECWLTDGKLDFTGDFYNLTLMTPEFVPDPAELSEFGVPKIFLAGVGEVMTEVAGEVCDGFICHGFTTERYLREVTIPALARGRAKVGKTMEDFEVVGPGFVVTGLDEQEMATARAGIKEQLGFYSSTLAYRPVLDLHGWGDLQTKLHAMSKAGDWANMSAEIDNEVLDAFAIVGEPENLAAEFHRRFGTAIQRIRFTPKSASPRWDYVIAALRASS